MTVVDPTRLESTSAIRWFQHTGLILQPERHQRHHRDYKQGFCVTSGWMNTVLDALLRVSRLSYRRGKSGIRQNSLDPTSLTGLPFWVVKSGTQASRAPGQASAIKSKAAPSIQSHNAGTPLHIANLVYTTVNVSLMPGT
jgi:hypothetical protein